jgi:hypothetical protein
VTLSHCWGNADFLTLNEQTSSQFFTGIDQHLLPLTFRDAINIARKLGIHYLWIDSLCIYQDNTSDWTIECDKMSEVYSRSYCNIGASAAHNPFEGCFRSRDPHIVEPYSFLATWSSTPNGLKNLVYPGPYHLYIEDFWELGIAKQPLMQRAWVVQERLLAPRTIHFSNPQVFWECKYLIACETFPTGIPTGLSLITDPSLSWRLSSSSSIPYKPSSYGLFRHSPQTFFFHKDPWRSIVQAYSKCKLTRQRDKLPAIAGIAKSMGLKSDRGRYVAGLWEDGLLYQLMWFVEDSSGERPSEYRAPSWSWASIDGPIFILLDEGEISVCSVEIFTVDTLPENKSDDAVDRRWFIRLQGPLHKLTVKQWSPKSATGIFDFGIEGFRDREGIIFLDCEPLFEEETKDRTIFFLPMWHLSYESRYSGVATRTSWDGGITWSTDSGKIEGLALRLTGQTYGEYERIGRMKFYLQNAIRDANTLNCGPDELPCSSYESTRVVNIESEQNAVQYLYTFTIL